MLLEGARLTIPLGLLLPLSLLCAAQPFLARSQVLDARGSDPKATDEPIPGGPVNDNLPAQIGGIIGAYAASLVLVTLTLVALSKKRHRHIAAGIEEVEFAKQDIDPDFGIKSGVPLNIITESSFVQPLFKNSTDTNSPNPYIHPSPSSTVGAPGTNPFVDQRVVAADRVMAQSQLEDMYRHVLEAEDAKRRGVAYDPLPPTTTHQRGPSTAASILSLRSAASSPSKKERTKPANLDLNASREEKSRSRTSSLLSALRSPKKKSMKGMNISSPIMTPQSTEFPRHESQEMNMIPPRHYTPAAPPPVPTDQVPYAAPASTHVSPPTPDISPQSVQTIDERIGSQLPPVGHSRNESLAPTDHEREPESATSENSQAPLVGLPQSPKPGSRFPSNVSLPSLPSSPKPGSTFNRSNTPASAVRAGGALPLRAYEPAMASPNSITQTTKQTVFERKGPLSPGGGITPRTAGAVPYSPYQPFTPCMPMTPSLVTKEDRKRMRRMVPKTPTLEMVKSADDIW